MRRLEDLYAFHQLQNRCAQMLVASKHAHQQPTFTPHLDPECLQQLNPLNMLRKVYGWGWFLELAATYVLALLALAALVFAVVDAYDAERTHSAHGGGVTQAAVQPESVGGSNARPGDGPPHRRRVVRGPSVLCSSIRSAGPPAAVGSSTLPAFVRVRGLGCGPHVPGSKLLPGDIASVVEPGTWGAGALSRSSELIKGHRWKAVALMLPYALFYWPILTVPQGLVKPSIGLAAYMVASHFGLYMFVIIVPTVFYLKCRAYWSAVKQDVELGGQGYEHLDKLVKESEL